MVTLRICAASFKDLNPDRIDRICSFAGQLGSHFVEISEKGGGRGGTEQAVPLCLIIP